MNTDPSGEPGSHWVAVHIDGENHGDYFDSYGRQPQTSSLVSLLKKTCSCWAYNEQQVQSAFSSVCGQYCVYFLLQRTLYNTPMTEIVAKFSKEDYEENDEVVTEWVNENFELNTETYNVDFFVKQICRALLSS